MGDEVKVEAPAEAGEREGLAAELDRLADCEGGMRGGSERAAETMRQAAKALRAQPQAREEGGAVSERLAEIATWTDEDWETVFAHRPDLRDRMRAALATRAQPLYTHPAPDALRVAVEALEAARKVIELFRDKDVLSEGVHTGLRKGTDAKDAHDLWTAIRNSKTSAWSDAIAFALDPYFSMWGGDAAVTKIDQALAALQAEQKGGA